MVRFSILCDIFLIVHGLRHIYSTRSHMNMNVEVGGNVIDSDRPVVVRIIIEFLFNADLPPKTGSIAVKTRQSRIYHW
jgi:hypothetical protein